MGWLRPKVWTGRDLDWLAINYPELIETTPGTIEGDLYFHMLRADGKYIVNPSSALVQDKRPTDYINILDVYKVRICWSDGRSYPDAYEIEGKLNKVAKKLNKSLSDMHKYEDSHALCLTAHPALEKAFRGGFNLERYIIEFLIPYFFAQSHFAGSEEWLWGELSHGYLGLLEWLGRQAGHNDDDIEITSKWLKAYDEKGEIINLLASRPRGHNPCPCGRKKRARDCHPDVLRGISILRAAKLNNKL